MRVARLFRLLFFAGCAALSAGCGAGPEDVFKALRKDALARDPAAIWPRLTPSTRKALSVHAADFFSGLGGRERAAVLERGVTEEEVFEYFSGLVAGLEVESVEYIRSLRAGKVTEKGDTATMTLASMRYGRPEKAIIFERIDGEWLWDAREILEVYLEKRWR